jgi:hypothetical protein
VYGVHEESFGSGCRLLPIQHLSMPMRPRGDRPHPPDVSFLTLLVAATHCRLIITCHERTGKSRGSRDQRARGRFSRLDQIATALSSLRHSRNRFPVSFGGACIAGRLDAGSLPARSAANLRRWLRPARIS